jgi:hypothetical protein
MNPPNAPGDAQEIAAQQSSQDVAEPGSEEIAAWQEIEAGRFMPRRIRGSYRGRALG